MLITQAKPNPLGKDRFGNVASANQLAGEWLDIRNDTALGISLSNLELHHIAYSAGYPNGVWEKVFSIDWTLPAWNILRIHSGGRLPIEQMVLIDQNGADYHAFTGINYVWNNDRSDTPRLYDRVRQVAVDQVIYNAYPEEGRILIRRGDYLV